MLAIISLLLALTLSLILIRIATLAMIHTGMSEDMARFQTLSAFTGAGFTTRESESITTHPVRRRIAMVVILLGNVGFITFITSLVVTFLQPSAEEYSWVSRAAVFAGGLVLLWLIGGSKWVDKLLGHTIALALKRWTELEVRDYHSLLNVSDSYSIGEIEIHDDNWMVGKTLMEMRLSYEGILVLGIKRKDGNYLGTPRGTMRICPYDRVVLYGRRDALMQLERRPQGEEGDRIHKKAVAENTQRTQTDGNEPTQPA